MAAVLTGSCISAVNLEEALNKMVQYGKKLEAVSNQIERLRIPVILFDAGQAGTAASLWTVTRPFGLAPRRSGVSVARFEPRCPGPDDGDRDLSLGELHQIDHGIDEHSRPHDRAVETAVSAAIPPGRGVRELRGNLFIDVDSQSRLVIRVHVTLLDLRRTREQLSQSVGEECAAPECQNCSWPG